MLSAQDEAFVRLAIQRGALAPGALPQLAGAPVSHMSAVQVVVDQGWLSSLEATGLLREVMGLAFACPGCGWRTSYEGLAARSTFSCPCGGGLAPLPQRPVSGSSFPLPAPERSRGPEDSDFVRQAFGSTRFRAEVGPGQVLGGYHLERELGRGANGVVYLARRPGLEREFALKVLLEDQTLDAETIARFELEAAIGSKLRDPGVVSVYDVGRVEDCLYYAMEYSPGPTLKEVLRERGRLPWEEGVELVRQLAETLAHCHERSVIHRDLKPGNIILDTELDRPRVTDFGLARDRTLAQTMTATGDWLGTPYYMSPEQFRGERDLDHRADLYALGTILFEVLTGERPYVAKTAQELMELVLEGRPPSPRSIVPDLPAGLDHIVSRAMEAEPENRYSDAKEIAKDLEAIQAGRRLGPQRTRLAAGLFLAAAALFAATAFVYNRGATPAPPASAPPSQPTREPTPEPSPSATSEYDWAALLADWRTWTGDLDLEPLREREPPLDAERLAALEATRELARAARSRAAPWHDLSRILKRARAPKDWVAYNARLDFLEARLLLARGRSRAALEVLGAKRSHHALWLRTLANQAAGNQAQADDLLARLAKEEGPESALARARLARSASELERALGLIEGGGEIPEAKLELAETLSASGDEKRAARALEDYLERSGPSPRALRLKGDMALARGEVAAATSAFELAAQLLEQDEDLGLLERRARALVRGERSSDAVELLTAAIPLARVDEELTPAQVRFLVLRGLAEARQGAAARARADWARAGEANEGLARAALPATASEEEREAFELALAPPAPAVDPFAGGPTPTAEEAQAAFNLFKELMTGSGTGPWYKVQALGELPAAAQERFAVPSEGSQTQRDLRQALQTAALGKSWKDVRFYLTRALETGQAASEVRATWMRLARARASDVEAVGERLASSPGRYGLRGEEARFALAEVTWFQGRAGEALAAFQAHRADAKKQTKPAPAALLSSAYAALLEGQFAQARRVALSLGEEHQDGRGFALAGLASLALREHGEAAKQQRIAYGLLGASDYRVLALRGALAAGSGPVVGMFGSGEEGAEARANLNLGGRPAELLALRVLVESDQDKLRAFAAAKLADLKSVESAELAQLLGYSWVRLEKERARCLQLWKRARGLDPKLPLPKAYLEAYAEVYGSEEGLGELR